MPESPSGNELTSLDRKSTRLNSSHTEIYTLSLHDALPISVRQVRALAIALEVGAVAADTHDDARVTQRERADVSRSEEHTSELQSHRDLHSFPTRRSSDLRQAGSRAGYRARGRCRSGRHARRCPSHPAGTS